MKHKWGIFRNFNIISLERYRIILQWRIIIASLSYKFIDSKMNGVKCVYITKNRRFYLTILRYLFQFIQFLILKSYTISSAESRKIFKIPSNNEISNFNPSWKFIGNVDVKSSRNSHDGSSIPDNAAVERTDAYYFGSVMHRFRREILPCPYSRYKVEREKRSLE